MVEGMVNDDENESIPTRAGHAYTDAPGDPLERLERNERSGKQAYIYAGSVFGLTVVTAIIIAIIGAITGGPLCDAGKSVFVCSRAFELAFPLIPGAISFFGAAGCFWMTYLKWRSFQRWRPWLAMCWVLLPWTLAWMTGTFSIAMFGLS